MEDTLSSIEEAIQDLQQGKAIIVVDDEDRENEGDLVIAAEHATPAVINFMAKEARGLICIAMQGKDLDRLQIPMMVTDGNNDSPFQSPFTVSVEAREGVTTGISTYDRSHTVQKLVSPTSTPNDFVKPGHIFPLRAREGGVLERPGHTEAGVDLAKMAQQKPAAVICEIMDDDGSMARLPSLKKFADKHQLKIISIADLIKFRRNEKPRLKRVSSAGLPTRYGNFQISVYQDREGKEHFCLTMGDLTQAPIARIHSECVTGDILHSLKCDCGHQLDMALKKIAEEEKGILIYLRQEGRGIGLANKIKAYSLQEDGMDTVEANLALGLPIDAREYQIAVEILHDQAINKIRLLTNNPHKMQSLEDSGIEIVERVTYPSKVLPQNENYLKTKVKKLNHLIEFESFATAQK